MKYHTMNQGVATTCATCDGVGGHWETDEFGEEWGWPCEDCPDPTCGTEDNPHQWAQVPREEDRCGRCQREYKACGTAWHEVGR